MLKETPIPLIMFKITKTVHKLRIINLGRHDWYFSFWQLNKNMIQYSNVLLSVGQHD